MRRTTALAASGLVAALLTGCTPGAAEPSPPTAQPAAPAASSSAEPSVEAPRAAPSAAESPDPGAPEPDPGAPTATPGPTSGRPGLDGTPDPAALLLPGPAADGPNLGSTRYLQPVTTLSKLPASPVLDVGFSGAKVHLIQQKFGITRRVQEFDAETRRAVLKFQSTNGLEANGRVGRETWTAMFPAVSWEIDRYRAEPALDLTAGPNARIEQMISYMRTEALGAPYVWGSAGPKQYGYDCSGLMLQAMYSAGIEPRPINVVDHQRPSYPTAQQLYNHPGFKHVPRSQAKRGDMVFFGPANRPERITHVAMFLGNGYVLEAIPSTGVSEDRFYESYRSGSYVIRPDAVRIVG